MGNIFHAGFGLEGFLLLFDLFLLLIHPSGFFVRVDAGGQHVADGFAPFFRSVE